jgi:hypothetical protein
VSSFLPGYCRSHAVSSGVVTARYFGDPAQHRAGKAPDCEDSRQQEELEQVRKLLGLGEVVSERALRAAAAEMKNMLDDRDRLKPRRYRPAPTPFLQRR